VLTFDYRNPMGTTEIEKLERRYAENPQGLTFAPLAEVHRKNGDVGRALELLRAGLELHPNYIPASIVLGRCHWDAGDLPAAESAFAHVLRLDDENVIALKSLADINERLERFGEAQRWLNRLLSIDRSNDEARQQLARLDTAKLATERKKSEPAPAVAAEVKPEVTDLPSRTSAPAPEHEAPSSPLASEQEPRLLDLTAELADVAEASPLPPDTAAAVVPPAQPASPTLEFLDTSEAPPATSGDGSAPQEAPPLAGLISSEFVPPKENAYRLHPELTHEVVPPSTPEGPHKPEVETADDLEVETAEDLELQSSGASEFRVPNAAEDFLDLGAAPAPPPVAARPDPTAVAAPAPVQLKDPEPAPPPTGQPVAPSKPAYAAGETRGQSVASFFASLLAARPPGASAAPASSAPEALTVSAGEPSSAAGVSFDEFFSAAAGGPSGSAAQGEDEPGKDDLDQFQSWLQNLKR
jgi:Tetratricopeptide repeat